MSSHESAPGSAASRSYRPGDWFGVFGEQATVVLPPSEKARVATIWALVDDGAGFDEVLDALIADGLRDLPGFVLVSEADGETRVVIRGAAKAEFSTADDTVTVQGSTGTTWAEKSFTDVRSMRIDVADSDAVDDLPIRGGLVRIARADRPARTSEPVPPLVERVETPGEARVEPFEPPRSSAPQEPAPALDETAYFPPPPPMARETFETPRSSAPREPLEIGLESPLDDDPPTNPQQYAARAGMAATGERPVVPAAEPAADGPVEHDGLTRAGNWDPGDFARSQPGIPGQPPTPSVLAVPVAKLTFSSGDVVEVDRAVIVGRAPEARRFTSTEQPRLVTVPSPNQEISSTHLEIRPGAGADHGSAVVTDLGSTNGTVLVQPGLPPEDLQPGIAVQLIPGAIVDLGDGVTIQVGHG